MIFHILYCCSWKSQACVFCQVASTTDTIHLIPNMFFHTFIFLSTYLHYSEIKWTILIFERTGPIAMLIDLYVVQEPLKEEGSFYRPRQLNYPAWIASERHASDLVHWHALERRLIEDLYVNAMELKAISLKIEQAIASVDHASPVRSIEKCRTEIKILLTQET